MTKKMLFAVSTVTTLVAILTPVAVAQSSYRSKIHPSSLAVPSQRLETLIALEATQNMDMYFTTQLGAPMSGSWSGTVTNTGWNLTFTGSFNGQQASITETGFLKKKTASWKDSGTLGGSSVNGNGTVTLKGSILSGSQTIGSQTIPDDEITWTEIIACIVSPANCGDYIVASQLGGGGPFIDVVSQLNNSTGTVFGSSIQQSPLLLTTLEEGSIAFSTGAISYNVKSESSSGGSASQVPEVAHGETSPARHSLVALASQDHVHPNLEGWKRH